VNADFRVVHLDLVDHDRMYARRNGMAPARIFPVMMRVNAAILAAVNFFTLDPSSNQDFLRHMRICPVRPGTGMPIEAQFNVELRATDATANPYLVLGLVARAGLEGLRAGLETDEPFEGDPTAVSREDLARLGIERLPTSLEIALDRLEARGADFVPPDLLAAFVGLKRAEAASLAHASPEEIALAYREAF
jgi:glutamine synthetase